MEAVMNDDSDDSYVPDSLKGFFAEADKMLAQNLADVMQLDYSKPNSESSVDRNINDQILEAGPALIDDDDSLYGEANSKPVFYQITDQDKNKRSEQNLDESDDFFSPPLQAQQLGNPAADLSLTAARQIIMGEENPNESQDLEDAVADLRKQLDRAALEELIPPRTTVEQSPRPRPETPVSKSSPGVNKPKSSPSPLVGRRGAALKLRDKMRGRKVAPANDRREVAKPNPPKLPEAGRSTLGKASPSPSRSQRMQALTKSRSPSKSLHPAVLTPSKTSKVSSPKRSSNHDNSEGKPALDAWDDQLPPQKSGGVTQRPIGDKGLQVDQEATTTITELHPKALHYGHRVQDSHPDVVGCDDNPTLRVSGDIEGARDEYVDDAPFSSTLSPVRPPPMEKDQDDLDLDKILSSPIQRLPGGASAVPRSKEIIPVYDSPSKHRRPLQERQQQQQPSDLPYVSSFVSDRSSPRVKEIAFFPDRIPTQRQAMYSGESSAAASFDLDAIKQATLPSKAKEMGNAKGKTTALQGSVPSHGRLLQGTAASHAKRGDAMRSPSHKGTDPWRGRKELTTPDKLPSRLTQGTLSSRARFAKEESEKRKSATAIAQRTSRKPISSRLLKPTEASKKKNERTDSTSSADKKKLDQGREAAKARVRARIDLQKRREAERKQNLQDRIHQRQQGNREKKEKMQAALSKARSKRERLESMEKERIAKLQQRIKEKDAKTKQRLAEKENKRPTSTSRSTLASPPNLIRPRKVTPTIPIAPTFRTELRLKSKGIDRRSMGKERIPLAHSDSIFKRGMRRDSHPPTPEGQSFINRPLTIPQGPRLSLSKRLGDKGGAQPTATINSTEPKARSSWENELRSVSSPMASDRSTSSRLTIPQTPKFHEIHHRPLPKSTAEKEREEMEYFKAHPFKARPNEMNDTGSVTRPVVPRPLTTPSPFKLRTDERLGPTPTRGVETPQDSIEVEVQSFKARPMPSFKSKRTSLGGKASSTKRRLTTPEPFRFATDKREKYKTPRSSPPEEKSGSSQFKARQMPDFSRHTGLTMYRRTPRSRLDPDESPRIARARNFTGRTSIGSLASPTEIEVRKFQARPMPNFSRVRIPVQQKSPEKTRSPRNFREEEPEVRHTNFRARKMPSLSTPSIPVHDRDPTKLRSPEDFQRPQPPPIVIEQSSFLARPMPKPSPPSIPVKEKDPSKLRSPRTPSKVDPPVENLKPFKARTMPDFYKRDVPSPTKASISVTKLGLKGDSPPKRAAAKLAARARVRDRMMGKKSDSTSKFSSTAVRSRLKAVAPIDTPEPPKRENKDRVFLSGLPSSILFGNTTSQLTKDRKPSSDIISSAPAGLSVSDTQMAQNVIQRNEDSKKRILELRQAAQDWLSPSATQKSSEAVSSLASRPPVSTIETRNPLGVDLFADQENSQSQRFDDAIQMALQLQRAAEEELSFHGSMHSSTTGRSQKGYAPGGYV